MHARPRSCLVRYLLALSRGGLRPLLRATCTITAAINGCTHGAVARAAGTATGTARGVASRGARAECRRARPHKGVERVLAMVFAGGLARLCNAATRFPRKVASLPGRPPSPEPPRPGDRGRSVSLWRGCEVPREWGQRGVPCAPSPHVQTRSPDPSSIPCRPVSVSGTLQDDKAGWSAGCKTRPSPGARSGVRLSAALACCGDGEGARPSVKATAAEDACVGSLDGLYVGTV